MYPSSCIFLFRRESPSDTAMSQTHHPVRQCGCLSRIAWPLNCVYMQKVCTHISTWSGIISVVLPPAATTPFRRLVNERVASNELDCTRDYTASGTKCRAYIRERGGGYITTVVKLTRARSAKEKEGRGGINYSIQLHPPKERKEEPI